MPTGMPRPKKTAPSQSACGARLSGSSIIATMAATSAAQTTITIRALRGDLYSACDFIRRLYGRTGIKKRKSEAILLPCPFPVPFFPVCILHYLLKNNDLPAKSRDSGKMLPAVRLLREKGTLAGR